MKKRGARNRSGDSNRQKGKRRAIEKAGVPGGERGFQR